MRMDSVPRDAFSQVTMFISRSSLYFRESARVHLMPALVPPYNLKASSADGTIITPKPSRELHFTLAVASLTDGGRRDGRHRHAELQ
jgi:hypothetical protein